MQPKPIITRTLIAGWLLLTAAASGQSESYPNARLLAEPSWLEGRLTDPAILVVDMRPPDAYTRAHIPGAVNLPVGDIVTAVDGVPFELDRDQAQDALRDIGLESDHTVIIYDDLGMMNAARLLWTLEYVGHRDARVLHGGWNAWTAAGLPVEEGEVETAPSEYALEPQPHRLIDAEELLERLDDPELAIADARSREEYTGEIALAERGGRIPGAVHLPWFEALTGGDTLPATEQGWQGALRDDDVERFKPADELRAWLEEASLDPELEVVTYCQTLWRGAHLYFVLRLMGYENVRGYDGSWAEWGNRRDFPVERGEPEATPDFDPW